MKTKVECPVCGWQFETDEIEFATCGSCGADVDVQNCEVAEE